MRYVTTGRAFDTHLQRDHCLLMSSEIIFEVTEDETEGGFTAAALGHSIVTEADTWAELRANVREAVLCHFDEGKAPAVIRLHRVMDELVAVA
jgi:hypothetical protein